MIINFIKMEGIGNDYIFIDNLKNKLYENINKSKLAIKLSNRHFGIGSDGIVYINKSQNADCYMEMYNIDGTQGDMCGNAIRCIAKYLYENEYIKEYNKELTIETNSGIKKLKVYVENDKVKNVKVNMNKPIFDTSKIPLNTSKKIIKNELLKIKDKEFNITCVSMGNPHAVCVLNKKDNLDKIDIEYIGNTIQSLNIFPKGTNVEFVKVINKNIIEMLVWERGSGRTLACGTGACASVASLILNNICEKDDEITVKLEGGILKIYQDSENDNIYMTGKCKEVFRGSINYEEDS